MGCKRPPYTQTLNGARRQPLQPHGRPKRHGPGSRVHRRPWPAARQAIALVGPADARGSRRDRAVIETLRERLLLVHVELVGQ
jgi:hypothetical protein